MFTGTFLNGAIVSTKSPTAYFFAFSLNVFVGILFHLFIKFAMELSLLYVPLSASSIETAVACVYACTAFAEALSLKNSALQLLAFATCEKRSLKSCFSKKISVLLRIVVGTLKTLSSIQPGRLYFENLLSFPGRLRIVFVLFISAKEPSLYFVSEFFSPLNTFPAYFETSLSLVREVVKT